MNLQEACKILDLSPNASADEAKKRYRELTKKYHPDVNKDPDADAKFKKINEAYDRFKKGEEVTEVGNVNFSDFGGFGGFGGFGFNQNPFARRAKPRNIELIQLQTTISFKESVLGCSKDISYSRKAMCAECNGEGQQRISNGCTKCNGMGTITQRKGNMIFTQTCDGCGGVTQFRECMKCNGYGALDSDVSIQVKIPGGVINGNVLRLNGMGNFVGNFMNMAQYMDAHLTIFVTPHPHLRLEGKDIVSTLNISLLEALSGCTKSIETIDGDRDIIVKAKSRHKDEVIIPKLGVNGNGNHRVILDVNYPNDIQHVIEALSNKE
jgi:molecular chaperone DnaJ